MAMVYNYSVPRLTRQLVQGVRLDFVDHAFLLPR